jgi:hypothetical protein
VTTHTDYFPFNGGLDLMTPPLTLPPGTAQDAMNYECVIQGGVRRTGGYEAYDGRFEPHNAVYSTLPATITGSWADGNTITGLTSGHTAVILTSNENGFIVTKKTGNFTATEALQIAAVTVATCTATLYAGGAATTALGADYLNRAADVYRALIGVVPGSGDIRGVWLYSNVLYAFRDDAGGTLGIMHKETSSGWAIVAFTKEISFTAGNNSVNDGDTLTQGAVTATIQRVVAQSGLSPNIVGRLIITAVAGGNFVAGAATSTGGGVLTLSGAETVITLQPGGRYEFENQNFGGSTGTYRMYGVSGVSRGFEFDGTVFVPIATGMTTDTPNFIATHKNHLFFAYGASVQHSAPGTPYVWNAILGAAEIALGENVTGFMPEAGSASEAALFITTRNRSYILYGTSVLNWNLIIVNQNSGALAYTLQKVGQTYALDDIGVAVLGTTQNYGNFESATISYAIQSWITENRSKVISSSVNRELSQYRLFFSTQYALYITMGPKGVVGIMPIKHVHQVKCICNGELSDGTERSFFGSTDGYIYRMDVGSSFNGAAIDTRLKLVFNHSKSPRMRKRYRKIVLEISGANYAELKLSYVLGYGSTEISQPGTVTMTQSLSPAYWDSFVWDNFFWDGVSLAPSELSIDGSGENIAILITGYSDIVYPFTLNGAFISYSPRRQLR